MAKPSSSSTTAVGSIATAAATAVVSMVVVIAVGSFYHSRTIQILSKTWEDRRNEERKGRIRAEVKLRGLLKEQQLQQQQQQQQEQTLLSNGEHTENSSSKDSNSQTQPPTPTTTTTTTIKDQSRQKQLLLHHSMYLKCIGTVVSPYTKRVGTPRQGALVPSSRGYIDVSSIPAELFVGIMSPDDDYSHVWIVFGFHANTDLITSTKTKIRPPRAPPGTKVGQLATRSPHRPNPIGLSLVQLERYDTTTRRLYISGLDLVHGTPVYDIKPFVPWDIPGYYNDQWSKSQRLSNNNGVNIALPSPPPSLPSTPVHYRIPHWVSRDDDELSQVSFTSQALEQLQHVIDQGRLAPLYTNENDGMQAARETLEQILAQDPRSSHKGLKKTSQQRGSTSTSHTTTSTTDAATATSTYRLYFGNAGVDFVVQESGVQVISVVPVDFPPDAYMDGIPLASFM